MADNEAKWKVNQEKVAFLKQFPGLVQTWDQIQGQHVQAIIPFSSDRTCSVLVFSNGNFAIAHPPETEPTYLREGVETARNTIEPLQPEAYTRYDVLAANDKEATRVARLENILGAIHNNMEQIPELKDRIRSLVKEWNS